MEKPKSLIQFSYIDIDFGECWRIPIVHTRQNDTGSRYLKITPKWCGKKIDLPDETIPQIIIENSNNPHFGIIENGYIVIELNAEMLSEIKDLTCKIRLFHDNACLTSQKFLISIEEDIYMSDNPGMGAKWYAVTTIPASLFGSEGDWALNTTNGDAYQKTSGIWTLKCNLKGKDGSAGANATINGVTALTIQQGSNINITQTGSVMTISSTASGGSGDGKSAYQIAVDNGFTGSEVEWLASLKGDKGDPGASGKSAYQVAQEAGYTGTEAQYNELLAKAPDAIAAANNAAETVLAKFPYNVEVLTQSEYQAKVTAATLSNTTLYFIKDVT